MTVSILYAFLEGRLAGVFQRTGEEAAHFEPNSDAPATPLSLSLAGGTASAEAAFAYLDNLLPDNEEVRRRIAETSGSTADTFELLALIGEDVAGAVSLSADETLPARQPEPVLEAVEDDIAYHVANLRIDPTAPPPRESKPRWSLAGQQAKFSLSNLQGRWFWSTYERPSTHIFKPESRRHHDAQAAEYACLTLAAELGIPASNTQVVSFAGQSVIQVERWDRYEGKRLHAEDLLQALGLPSCEKYSIPAEDIVALLRPHGQDWAFVRQLLFNTFVGNADAHAKNYTLLLGGSKARLAPLYDVLPMAIWPHYSQTLAMHINRKHRAEDVGLDDWLAFADANRLNQDMMIAEVRQINAGVGEGLPQALLEAGVSAAGVDRVAAQQALLRLPSRHKGTAVAHAPAPQADVAEVGRIWVQPHLRGGRPVHGHWRKHRS